MASSVVGVDLSKSVFQLSIADGKHHVVDRKRLTRAQFHRFLAHTGPVRLVMEACEWRYPYDRTPPETTTQPDALDAVDANHLPQGLAGHRWRRPRRLRRVYLGFLPRGRPHFTPVPANRLPANFEGDLKRASIWWALDYGQDKPAAN